MAAALAASAAVPALAASANSFFTLWIIDSPPIFVSPLQPSQRSSSIPQSDDFGERNRLRSRPLQVLPRPSDHEEYPEVNPPRRLRSASDFSRALPASACP